MSAEKGVEDAKPYCVFRRYSGGRIPERERGANRLAASLLMPEDLLREHFQRLASNPQYRIEVLMERFGVSRSGLMVRLRELELILREEGE